MKKSDRNKKKGFAGAPVPQQETTDSAVTTIPGMAGGGSDGWCVALFIAASVYVIGWALAFDSAWMHPEAFIWKSRIMQDIQTGSWWNIFRRVFDVQLFEYAPRSTRPLASAFEILDTLYRSTLWRFVTPHPSVSLSWFLTLGIAPWLLYRILSAKGLSTGAALGGVAIYLTQMGTLSNTVVLFRSAKPVALFFLILCWRQAEQLRADRFTGKRYALLLGSLFVSFLFDESTLLTYLLAALILARTLFRRPGAAILFVVPLLCYLAVIFRIFPWLSAEFGFTVNGQHSDLSGYGKSLNLAGLVSFDAMYLILLNVWIMLKESFCLHNPFSIPGLLPRSAIFLHLCVTVLLVFAGVWRIAAGMQGRQRLPENSSSVSSLLFTGCCGVIAVLFHGMMMSLVDNQVWGPFYYGAYFGVLIVFLCAELWKYGGALRTVTCVWMGTLMLSSMVTFPAMNQVYRRFHFFPYQPLEIVSFFGGQQNRFTLPSLPPLRKSDIRSWSDLQWTSRTSQLLMPKEALWVLIERGNFLAPGGLPNTQLVKDWDMRGYIVSRDGFQPVNVSDAAQ